MKNKSSFYKKNKYIDGFVYVFLAVFILISLYFKFNFILTSLLAIAFMIVIFLLYLFKYKLTNKYFFNNNYSNEITNITNEKALEIIEKYYTELKYKTCCQKNKMIIEKNKKKYRVVFLLNKITLKDIRLYSVKPKGIDGTIIITNVELSKEIIKEIRKNKLYIISKPGLINIYEQIDKKEKSQNEEKLESKGNKEND